MRVGNRVRPVVVGVAWILLLAGVATDAAAQSPGKCTCENGRASWLYLRCPKPPPFDPDPCPTVAKGEHPERGLPKGWNATCARSKRMSCFLRRHAASWKFTCSLCMRKKCCPFPNWHNCPECHGPEAARIDVRRRDVEAVLARHGGAHHKDLAAAISKHYIVITDIPAIKLTIGLGRHRLIDQHELLHVYIQRCEQARADWSRAFGPPMDFRTVCALTNDEESRRRFSLSLFGHREQRLLYGGGGVLEGGLAQNGFALSVPKVRESLRDDHLHWNCRHMIGHLCMSTFHTPGMFERELPRWVFCGSAHWLARVDPRNDFHAYFCSHEGVDVGGKGYQPAKKAGTVWPFRVRRIAKLDPKDDPVERMFQASTVKQLDYRMHLRAWSWFDVFLRHDRDAFVKFIKRIREAKEARIACKGAFGQTPELVDLQWRALVLGKERKRGGSAEPRAASRAELAAIRTEKETQLLANRIRGLGQCRGVSSAKLLVRLIDKRESDRVREVIALVLLRTGDERVLSYLRGTGWRTAGKLARATLARVFGRVRDKKAIDPLRGGLQDAFWLVRANSARALAQMADSDSVASLAILATQDQEPKVRIAAMEALASFDTASAHVADLAANLNHKAWQVRSTTCDVLARIGDEKAVDALIERMETEDGRVREDIRRAIASLVGVDRRWSPRVWKAWWAKAKNWRAAERKSKRELGDQRKAKSRDRYASQNKTPHYYGVRIFAKSICYVLDTSLSMEQALYVPQATQRKLGRKYTARTRFGVCRQELEASVKDLDPRTRFGLVFFNEKAQAWKDAAVVASPGAKRAAMTSVRALRPSGQTNYYDALRLVLGMEGRDSGWKGRFANTPDTVLFLTDGTPTDGEITKSDELLSWWRERNRFARLRVHVIAMGVTNVDVGFLRNFAAGSGGTFVHLKGKY